MTNNIEELQRKECPRLKSFKLFDAISSILKTANFYLEENV